MQANGTAVVGVCVTRCSNLPWGCPDRLMELSLYKPGMARAFAVMVASWLSYMRFAVHGG